MSNMQVAHNIAFLNLIEVQLKSNFESEHKAQCHKIISAYTYMTPQTDSKSDMHSMYTLYSVPTGASTYANQPSWPYIYTSLAYCACVWQPHITPTLALRCI